MSPPELLAFGNFQLDFDNECVWQDGKQRQVTAKAFAVLRYLAHRPHRVVTKEELFTAVWPNVVVSDGALYTCIRELRRVLGDSATTPQIIETVHRRGFRFLAHVDSSSEKQQSPRENVSSIPSSQPSAPLLVGRATELAHLHNLQEKAMSSERQLVFITGEPGIGKTTLVDAFLQRLGTPAQSQSNAQPSAERVAPCSARGQCIEHYGQGEAYLPVLEALGRLARSDVEPPLKVVLEHYAPTWLLHLPALVTADEAQALQARTLGVMQERMLRELAEALEIFTTTQPLILIFEDLHWADASTLTLLSTLAHRHEPARLLIVGTYRTTEATRDGMPLSRLVQNLAEHHLRQEIAVSFLDEDAIATYLAARFPCSLLPTRLAEVLYHRTEGNPLFVVSLLQDWLTRGLLTQSEDTWTFNGDIESLQHETPEGIRQLVSNQGTRLPPELRRILEAASIAGREFSAAEVAAALSTDVAEIEDQCTHLATQHQFVRRAGISEWPDQTVTARYAFLHAVHQTVWHEQVSPARLQAWHQRIGERKEIAYGERAGEIAAELAVHFEQGRMYDKVLHYLKQAADIALQRSAYSESIKHLRKAITLLLLLPESPQRAQQELRLQAMLSVPLLCTKGYSASEVESACIRAYQLCQQFGEAPQLFPIVFGLFRYYLVRGDLLTARTLGEQLLRLAHGSTTPLLLPAAYAAVGGTLFHLGEVVSAQALVGQGYASYDQLQHNTLVPLQGDDAGVICLSFAAWALWVLGYPDQALAKGHEAFSLAQQSPYTYIRASNFIALALCFMMRRELPALQEWVETGSTYCVAQGFPYVTGILTVFRGWALAMQGHPEIGLAQLQQGLTSWQMMGAGLWIPYFLGILAEAYKTAELVETGLYTLSEAQEQTQKTEQRWCEAELYRLKGELTLQKEARGLGLEAGSPSSQASSPEPLVSSEAAQEAEECFRNAIAIAQKQQAKSWELRATMSLARLWHQQGKCSEAHHMLSEIYNWFTEGFDTKDLQEAKALIEELRR